MDFGCRLSVMCALAGMAGGVAIDVAIGAEVPRPVEESISGDISLLPGHSEPAEAAKTSTIPEPVSLAVFGTGLLLLLRRRRAQGH